MLDVPPTFDGVEIELDRSGRDHSHVHSVVRERDVGGSLLYAAVFPDLRAGSYFVCCSNQRVTIEGGRVARLALGTSQLAVDRTFAT